MNATLYVCQDEHHQFANNSTVVGQNSEIFSMRFQNLVNIEGTAGLNAAAHGN